MRLPDQWDMCSRIISIDYPYSLAYWGVMIAVGLDSGDIALFDVITGRRKSVLSSHTDPVWSLSFSPDGSLLASGGEDNTVKLWDIQTGGLVRTFSGHLRSIRATSISSDCTTIASGAWDGTVHLWNIRAGNCHTVEGHGDPVTTISFSPINSQHFVSSLSSQSDCTVQQWNTDGCKVGEASHEADEVGCIAYTSDGAHFVSCGGTVATVRNSESGKMVVKLNAPTDEFHCCCFSPDGRFVACAAGEMIYVWSITKSEAHLIGNLVGHSSTIIFLAFSSPSSLISGSEDNTVRTWQSVSFLLNPVISGNIPTSVAPAPIKSVSVFEKDDIVIISDSAGMVRTWDLKTGICKSSFSTPIKGIQDVHLAGDTLIGVVSQDPEVDGDYNIWDVGKGQLLRAIPIRLGDGLRISGDGFRIFGTHYNMIQCVSVETGEHLHTIDCFEEYGTEAGLVVHGTKVWIEGTNEMGWDFGGKEVTTFSLFKEFPGRLFLGYSNKSKTGIKPPWVQDTVTGRLAFHLPERYLGPSTKKRLHGQYLVMGSPPGEVVIIDFGSVCH